MATHAPKNEVLIANGSMNYSKVNIYIKGVRISNSAYDFTTTPGSVIYDPTFNGDNVLTGTERIQFDYFY